MECELPNRDLYEFSGTLSITSIPYPIPVSTNQVLLRGSKLKNTKWINGLVIYTGHDTKLMMVSESHEETKTMLR
jgi:magnesium-transporting ATPase (P-type)